MLRRHREGCRDGSSAFFWRYPDPATKKEVPLLTPRSLAEGCIISYFFFLRYVHPKKPAHAMTPARMM